MNEKHIEKWEKARAGGKFNFILMQTLRYVLMMTIGSSLFYYLLQKPYSMTIVVSIFFLVYLVFGLATYTISWRKNEKLYNEYKNRKL